MVQEVKLLGVIVSQDLKWQNNANIICKKASKKLRILRRLKKFNIKTFQLFDVYQKEVRSILEYAVPVWNSGITKEQSNQIERVQKVAFRMILEESYIDYEVACTLLSTEPLYLRRIQLCINFAKKGIKGENSLCIKTSKNIHTRSVKKTG